jgi:tRNA pseudouridine38-40 synthase
MIYQIRKMIGSLLAVIHKKLDVLKFSTEALFSQTKMAVPIAPGTGLYLEQCIFDTYNSKLDRLTREKCEGERGILNLNLFDDQRSAFFTSKIFPEICNRELADQEFKRWLIYLNKEWNQIVSNANEIIDSNELNSDDSSALE